MRQPEKMVFASLCTKLPRIDWSNGSTTPAPDFAPLHQLAGV